MYRRMSDSRQSPIPQDRVAHNIDERQRAGAAKEEQRQQAHYLEEEGVDERPGVNPKEQPGIPNEPTSPAEGGD